MFCGFLFFCQPLQCWWSSVVHSWPTVFLSFYLLFLWFHPFPSLLYISTSHPSSELRAHIFYSIIPKSSHTCPCRDLPLLCPWPQGPELLSINCAVVRVRNVGISLHSSLPHPAQPFSNQRLWIVLPECFSTLTLSVPSCLVWPQPINTAPATWDTAMDLSHFSFSLSPPNPPSWPSARGMFLKGTSDSITTLLDALQQLVLKINTINIDHKAFHDLTLPASASSFLFTFFHFTTYLIYSELFVSPFLDRSHDCLGELGGSYPTYSIIGLPYYLFGSASETLGLPWGLFPVPLGPLSGLTSTEQRGMVTFYFLTTVFLKMPPKGTPAFLAAIS